MRLAVDLRDLVGRSANKAKHSCRSMLTNASPDFVCMKAATLQNAPFSLVNMPTMLKHGSTKVVLFHQTLILELLTKNSRIMVKWVEQVYGENISSPPSWVL